MKTVFLRVLEAHDKATALLAAIRAADEVGDKRRFEVEADSFGAVPRSPFCYWVSNKLRSVFKSVPPLQSQYLAIRGAYTTDDFRFYRLSWESTPGHVAQANEETWASRTQAPLVKGGTYSPFYADVHLLLRWANHGAEAKAFLSAYRERKGWGTDWSACLNGHAHYFRPGLTWSRRSQIGFSLRIMPPGCVFNDVGPAVFAAQNDGRTLLALLAVANSQSFRYFIGMLMSFGKYEVGVVQRTPVPLLSSSDSSKLAEMARRAWSLKRSTDACVETSHAFTVPGLLQVEGDTLAERVAAWVERLRTIQAELDAIQAEIDALCFALYNTEETDRRAITEGVGGSADVSADSAELEADPDDDTDDGLEPERSSDAVGLAAELVSGAVGVAFGRFDVRLATGARALPPEPEPFDALPVCSPAMLTGDDGLPVASAPGGYPLDFPENGILVHDFGHPRDLAGVVRAVFETMFGAHADRIWEEAAALLQPKEHDLRAWLAGRFFEHHLKRHSKSRRKAPILWQLSMPSGHYSVWLYAHRLTRDSFFLLQNEVVGPKLIHAEQQLAMLIQSAGGSPSAAERKEIAAQEAIVEELRAMLEEVKRVAPLWNPDLDDGVVLTMAPLWRLVTQCKPWQKELKAKWDELSEGKCDWAHLAMHLWPERVVPKCGTDRSIAIAHGLESEFWVECADGKWKARATPVRPVDELVRERSSPAVKAALKSLLDESAASGKGRPRGRRAAPPAATKGGSR